MTGEAARLILMAAAALLLLSAGIEDARTREIADRKSIALLLLAPVWWWANDVAPWPGMAVQLGIAATAFALFAGAFRMGMMGGGDVKLIGALALWLPPVPLLDMLTTMALVGGAVTLAMIVEHRWHRHRAAIGARSAPGPIEVPYGVAIAIAGMIVLNEPVFNQFA